MGDLYKIEVDTTGDGKADQRVTVEANSEEEAKAIVLARGTAPNLDGSPGLFPDPIIPPEPKPQPRSVKDSLSRALGLTARDILEAGQGIIAGPADLLSAGFNSGLNLISDDPAFQLPTNRVETLRRRLDPALPTPAGPEKITSTGNQLAIQSLTGGQGVGQAMRGSPATPLTPRTTTQMVGEKLVEGPAVEFGSGFAGGAGRELSAQAGGTPGEQAVAEFASGVVAPVGYATGARGFSGLRNLLMPPSTQAGTVLRESAVDPSRIANAPTGATNTPAGQLEPRTTGPASGDPGVLGLEASLRRTDVTGRFAADDARREASRRQALDVVGANKIDDLKAARGELDPGTELNQTPVDYQPVVVAADNILQGPNSFREQTRVAVGHFRDRIAGEGGHQAPRSVQELWNIRQDINDAMFGKFSAQRADRGTIDAGVFRGARQDLRALKEAIDVEIEKVVPGFRKYLDDYSKLAGEIEARTAVRDLGDTAVQRSIIDPATGQPRLSQAQFGRKAQKILNDSDIRLTDDQKTVITAIANDLDLQEGTLGLGRVIGSNTPRDLSVASVIGMEMRGLFNRGFINDILLSLPEKALNNRQQAVQSLLIDAMLDPRIAKDLLAEANEANLNAAKRSLSEFAALTFTSQVNRPMGEGQTSSNTLTDYLGGLLQ